MKAFLAAFSLLLTFQAHAQVSAVVSGDLVKKAIACAKENHNVPQSTQLGVIAVDETTMKVVADAKDASGTVAWIKVVDGQVYEQDLVTQNLLFCKSNN